MDPAQVANQLRPIFWAAARGALVLQIGVLVLGVFALTRPRVRAYYAAIATENARDKEP
jgi:hypothetical protein